MKEERDDLLFLRIAQEAANRSDCLRRKTGAALVIDGAPTLEAHNGTPLNTESCSRGGCPRCASEAVEPGGYERCACVHAQENAVALAAREGLRTEGASLFCTLRPCLGCLKTLIQAGMTRVVYTETVELDPDLEILWHRLVQESGLKTRHCPSRV